MKGIENHVKYAVCHAVTNAVVSAGERRENLKEYSVHCILKKPCQECKELTTLYDTNICDTE